MHVIVEAPPSIPQSFERETQSTFFPVAFFKQERLKGAISETYIGYVALIAYFPARTPAEKSLWLYKMDRAVSDRAMNSGKPMSSDKLSPINPL